MDVQDDDLRFDLDTFQGEEIREGKAYRPVTSIAEKCQFMVESGVFNSRMKDYYDVWFLCNKFQFEGSNLKSAIESTFTRRKTKVPEDPPPALQADFFENSQKQDQWGGFLERNNLSNKELPLKEVVTELRKFLLPVFDSISSGVRFEKKWLPGKGWIKD